MIVAAPIGFVLLLLLTHWGPELKIQRDKLKARRRDKLKAGRK